MVAAIRSYDLIGYGDEVPGVLALVAAAREYRRRTGARSRILLMAKGHLAQGLGGHLVRGQLSYLDRSHIAPALRQTHGLPLFGEPATLYREFLQRADVQQIALDWRKGDAALRAMVSGEGIDLLDRVGLARVQKTGDRLDHITLTNGETYGAKQWIDSTVNGELARTAGAHLTQGFGYFGLPASTLPVTLVFETQGLTVARLQQIERAAISRFLDPNDAVANQYLQAAARNRDGSIDYPLIQQWRDRLRDGNGNPLTLATGRDFIDVRCSALSILYHAYRQTKLDLETSGAILDIPNIAVLPGDRLSWNALLGFVTGPEADAIAQGSAQPTERLRHEAKFIERWLVALGARSVTFASELYVRYAGSLMDAVQPLSGAQMLAGGVAASEGLGTFSYRFDVRGGIPGLGARAAEKGYSRVGFLSEVVPTFNFGIRHALPQSVTNLAIVSPASGFTGIAPAAGRIVELNAGVGQGLGIAAAIALASGRNLGAIANREVVQVQQTTGQQPKVYGQGYGAAKTVGDFELALRKIEGLPTTPTDDIAGHWAEGFIKGLKAAQIVRGFPDGTFLPDRGLTRAEFASLLMGAFGDRPDRSAGRTFTDVPASFWGASAIAAASRKGFLSGFPDGSFRPQDPLTRTQALLALASGLSLGEGSTHVLEIYRDRDTIAPYGRPAIAAATARRIVVNYPQRDRLEPNRAILRGEVCALVYQALVAIGRMGALESAYIVDPAMAPVAAQPAIAQPFTTATPEAEPEATTTSPLTNPFSDTTNHWAVDYISALAADNLVGGFPDGRFRPDNTMTRAEFAAIVVKAFQPAAVGLPATFKDVPPDHWAATVIQQTFQSGFLAGVGDGRFSPSGPLLRVQVLVAIASGLGWPAGDASLLTMYDDGDTVPTWARDRVAAAIERGLGINPTDPLRFEPNRAATRAEVAAMVYLALAAEGRIMPLHRL
ncbi:MAG: S-layer homology domain-containing protein [Cyanobacteria bacterium]|nr:S-layer homology domain-containing protein [Cyanobacteriota bacterium]